MGSHPSQIGLPRSTFQGGVPLYQPGGNMGSWGSSPPPMYWQGFYGHPNGLQQMQQQLLLRPPRGMPMSHTMQQPMQQYTGMNPSLPTGTSNLPSLNLPASAPALPNATLTSSLPLASPLTTSSLDINPAPPNLNSNKPKMVHALSAPSYQTAPSMPYQTAPQSYPTIGGPPSSSHTETSSPALVTPGQLLQPGPSTLSTPHSTQPSHKDVEVVQPPSSEPPAPPPSVPEVKSPILPLPTPLDQKLNGAPQHGRNNNYHYRGRGRGRGNEVVVHVQGQLAKDERDFQEVPKSKYCHNVIGAFHMAFMRLYRGQKFSPLFL
ncbi:hypothetical protein ACHQM5_009126 [Ranunculus cassubicifolius]